MQITNLFIMPGKQNTMYISDTIASADYTSKSINLTFGPSISKQCVTIPVLNDTVPEVPEHFRVVLSMTAPLAGVILTPDNVTVVINDDDGKEFLKTMTQ